MNPLVNDFPAALCGVPIDTDFRRMVQFELLMQDASIPAGVKLPAAMALVYTQPVPNLSEAWDGLLWYYAGGQAAAGGKGKAGRRVYDFDADGERIYASFWQAYRIDLQETPLHWFAFRLLLFSLPQDTPQGAVMYYRGLDAAKAKGEERRRILKMQSLYGLDKGDHLSKAQREAAWLAKMEQRRREVEEQMKRGESNAKR